MTPALHTAWLGDEIGVYREPDELIDKIHAADIRRVVFVNRNRGRKLADLIYALVELPTEHLIFPAETGFAGRVLFERQIFWEQRACIYWVDEDRTELPVHLRRTRWFLRRAAPAYARLPAAELGPILDAWPLEGPQTWEQRKWEHIQRSRPFADVNAPVERRRA